MTLGRARNAPTTAVRGRASSTGMSGAGRSHRRPGAGGPRLVRGRQPAAACCIGRRWWRSPAGRRRWPRSPSSSTSAAGPSSPTSSSRCSALRERAGATCSVLFLEASDEALVRRFESSAPAAPAAGIDGRLLDGIAAGAGPAGATCGPAPTSSIDTSPINVHELRRRVESTFDDDDRVRAARHGDVASASSTASRWTPTWSLDVRFLPNPYWVARAAARTPGLDAAVQRLRARSSRGAAEFLDALRGLVRPGRRGLPARGQALRDRRRSAAPAASTAVVAMAEDARRHACVEGGHRDVRSSTATWGANEPVARPPASGAGSASHGPGRGARRRATGSPRPCRRCGGSPTRLTAVVGVADDGGRPGGCAASSGCCRRATCGWRWRPCAATTRGAGPGAGSSSTGSAVTATLRGPRRRQPADRGALGGDRRRGGRARLGGRPARAQGRVLPVRAVPLEHRRRRRAARPGRSRIRCVVRGQVEVATTPGEVVLGAASSPSEPARLPPRPWRPCTEADQLVLGPGLLVHLRDPAPARPRVAARCTDSAARAHRRAQPRARSRARPPVRPDAT